MKETKRKVQGVWLMCKGDFIFHCANGHPLMRFLTRNEHDQDHRINDKLLDHVHESE